MKESAIQSEIISALRRLGAIVCSTSSWGRPTTVTRGTPDLFVWHCGHWYALEVKSPKGTLSEEQKELVDIGAVQVVRSVDDALGALGMTKSAPDLLVWHKDKWHAMDVKEKPCALSEEQRRVTCNERVPVVRSAKEAAEVIGEGSAWRETIAV